MREIKQIYVTGVNRSGHSTLWEKIKVDPDIPSAMMGDEQFMLPWDIENHNHTDMLRKRFVDRVKQLVECSPDCNTTSRYGTLLVATHTLASREF